MKKYYFASGIRGIVGEHSGNIRGAKAKAQKLAEQLDEEITILVRSNKEIDCGKNIPANEEVCRVCNADGDVLAVCSTYGNAFAWCAENGIEGEIGEYEPYIEVGTYSENGNFEVEDYSSINTGDGMWNIINDYCYYVDKVCPEATAETVESVETKEKITMTKAEKIFETLTEDCETFIKEHTDFENTLTFSHRYFDEYNACVRTYNAVLKLVEKRYKDIVRKIKLGVWTTEDAHLPVLVNDAVKRTVEDAKMMEQKFQKELKEIHATFEETEENDEVTTVDSVEETTVSETVEETAEQETELNAEVTQVEAEQTAEPETFSKSKSESESEPTAENITVSGTNQDNINVLIVADIANTFEMITHTGYFDTS